ncbi:MAG TPA: hypothetical protein VF783_21275 [Terriglobales bacterium]
MAGFAVATGAGMDVVKLYEHEGELYVLAKSKGRQTKETAIRSERLGAVDVPFIISSAIAWTRMSW